MRSCILKSKIPPVSIGTLELAKQLISCRSVTPEDAGCLDELEQLPKIYLQTLKNLLIK